MGGKGAGPVASCDAAERVRSRGLGHHALAAGIGRDSAPLAGSMAAALPFCDAFLPAHTLRELSQVVDALASSTR